ncbi:MAG TPA: N-acetylmannosamine-6-phosphate 2-epimerase [Candidatus Cybelea sp.]|jgi:N-acylglucosamine-6-phosphate 2-epimerase|nr:N-acetylmannosamine-6-phosphate 2-epimerase [Candidatus Cybelea sp.]
MTLFERLRGGLIVSVQAWRGSALGDPQVIAAMARASEANGAVAVRIAGGEHLRAVRARVALPIVGLVKREYPGFEPYITPTIDEVREIADAGAEIVAFDATARRRPAETRLDDLIAAIHACGRLALADCATAEDAREAVVLGADAVATTLCGYTSETAGRHLPALDLVAELAALRSFRICEGGIRSPGEARAALDAGADAVVVGTAITNVDWLVREFAGATDRVFKEQ